MSAAVTEAQVAGFMAVEDTLIELRDSRMFIFPYANGVVVNERDGTYSSVVRMRTRHATDLAIETAAPLIAAQALRDAADALRDSLTGPGRVPVLAVPAWGEAWLRDRAVRIAEAVS